MKRFSWLGALVFVVFPSVSTAQAPDAPTVFGELIDVELVGVEVWVTDDDGNPVVGLTADDFAVRHDGESVEITHFSEVRAGSLAAAPAGGEPSPSAGTVLATAPEVAEPAHLVLYFDQMRLDVGGYRRVMDAVESALVSLAVPAERIMILRQDGGLHLEAPLGSSTAQIVAALERVAAGAHGGLRAATELQQARQAIQTAWEEAEDLSGNAVAGQNAAAAGGALAAGGGTTSTGSGPRGAVGGAGGGGGSILPSACDLFYQRAQPVVEAWVRDRTSRVAVTLSHLNDTAGFLSGLPGVKTLLYVSDGLDLEPGAALGGFLSDFCPTRSRDHQLTSLAEALTKDFESLAAHYNAHRVTIHAIQGSGLQASGVGQASERATSSPIGGGLRFESRQRQSERTGMSLIARETGGRAVFNQNDLTDELVAIARDMGHYYSIAYSPPEGAGRESRIQVDVERPGVEVRHRRGHRAPDPDDWMEERLAGAFHLDITSNPLDVTLGTGKAPAAGDPLRVFVLVPANRLVYVPGDDGAAAELQLRARLFSPASPAVAPVTRTVRVPRPAGELNQRLAVPLDLALAPGLYRMAVGLRDVHSGEASFVVTEVERP